MAQRSQRQGRTRASARRPAGRALAAARDEILSALRKRLRTALGLEPRDLESALALVRSQLDLSLSRHLRSRGPDGPST